MTSRPRTDGVIQWLFDGDPSIRWQILRDLVGAGERTVERERRNVARDEGNAFLLRRLIFFRQSPLDSGFKAAWTEMDVLIFGRVEDSERPGAAISASHWPESTGVRGQESRGSAAHDLRFRISCSVFSTSSGEVKRLGARRAYWVA